MLRDFLRFLNICITMGITLIYSLLEWLLFKNYKVILTSIYSNPVL